MHPSGETTVENLTVVTAKGAPLLQGACLRLTKGQITGLTGPSGAGKTTLIRALLGTLPPGASRTEGMVMVCGEDVFALGGKDLQRFRNRHLAFVAQDPGACLNPTMKVRAQLREAAWRQRGHDFRAALEQVQLSERHLGRRPGELSGGQQRRVALARALVRGVDVLLIDEPLAGLQRPLRRQIIQLLRSLVEDGSVAIAVTGHHADLEYELADSVVRVVPCQPGGPMCSTSSAARPPARPQPVEQSRPQGANGAPRTVPGHTQAAIAGQSVNAWFRGEHTLQAMDFIAPAGAVTAVMGASGAGKTTLARVLVGLHEQATGTLQLSEESMPITASRRTDSQRNRIQYVPQNPLSTLNPRKTVRETIVRPMKRRGLPAERIAARLPELLGMMGLSEDFCSRVPRELSGGQRQRVAIARALAAEPEVLVCDEITSALDAKTAESILVALRKAVDETGLSVILISHELDEIRDFSDHTYVVADGQIVESGPTTEIIGNPKTSQTAELLA
jgi:peptide/nickel transport system ATP-binding protein